MNINMDTDIWHEHGHGMVTYKEMDIQRFNYRISVKSLSDIQSDFRLCPVGSDNEGTNVVLKPMSFIIDIKLSYRQCIS